MLDSAKSITYLITTGNGKLPATKNYFVILKEGKHVLVPEKTILNLHYKVCRVFPQTFE